MKLEIACRGAGVEKIEDIYPFQGELKSLSKKAYDALKKELVETGFAFPLHVWKNPEGKLYCIGGHQRIRTLSRMREEGYEIPPVPVNYIEAHTYKQAKRRVLQDVAQYGQVERQGLYEFMSEADIGIDDLASSFVIPEITLDVDHFKEEFFGETTSTGNASDSAPASLSDKFLVPPFSVLDARQGYWQERKHKWLKLGIESEIGRDAAPGGSPMPATDYTGGERGDGKGRPIFDSAQGRRDNLLGNKSREGFGGDYDLSKGESAWGGSGSSIFDPVLCELAYRWFSPKNGTILDPFAGGSVRGIVASKLGRQYVGLDLRAEQIKANREQGQIICKDPMPVWHYGDSNDLDFLTDGVAADMVFSCPPYADLEVYSELPNDLSNMPYEKFRIAYRNIIWKACQQLKDNRFACFVVGEVRDKKGIYRNFVGDTVQAFVDAGLRFYNEGILVTAVGSLPIRSGRIFQASRKLGKTHQNILVFVKGDPKKATETCGEIELDSSFLESAVGASEQLND